MPLSDRTRRLALPLAAFLLGLVVLGVAAVLTLAPTSRPAGTAAVGGPFRLVDQDGRTVTDREFSGAPHLVFFGFTHCPDICPTKLFELSEVLRATGDKGRRLRALFITVDPERDTPEALKSYLSSFDERIVGLTGDPEAIQATVRAYRAFARKVPLKDNDYTLEHTTLVYLMDKNGHFVSSFNLNRPPAEAAGDLMGRL
jgi:protein SCO1/2